MSDEEIKDMQKSIDSEPEPPDIEPNDDGGKDDDRDQPPQQEPPDDEGDEPEEEQTQILTSGDKL